MIWVRTLFAELMTSVEHVSDVFRSPPTTRLVGFLKELPPVGSSTSSHAVTLGRPLSVAAF